MTELLRFRLRAAWTRVHRDQLESLARATPVAMIGYGINVGVAVFAFRGHTSDTGLALWAVTALGLCLYIGIRSFERSRVPSAPLKKSGKTGRSAISALVFAVLLALPWTLLAVYLDQVWTGDLKFVLLALVVGMAASGATLLSPVPAAALIYSATILLPTAIKCLFFLGGHYVLVGALTLSFQFFLAGLIVTKARMFRERTAVINELKTTIRALSEAREETERVAMTDGLTGIANRRAFMARLEALRSDRRADRTYGVFYIDLDRFKAVNDALGHGVGDNLLKTAAVRIEESIRKGDLVARLGGDEFAVIAHDIADRVAASALAERLVASLSEPYMLDGQKVQVGACVGVSLASECRAESDGMLKQADLAMYAAKGSGRGSFCIFEADMQRSADERRLIELGLRTALVNDGFELYYQPICLLATGEITGFECLLRWHHPLRGLLPPSQFMNIAQDIGLAENIGNWVITETCRQASKWPGDIRVGINLPSLQISSGTIADRVEKALKMTGLPARRLELEIEVSELSLLQDDPESIQSLKRLKAMGTSVALDDFGTGYSSLAYLVSFPFNRIKIDRLFVSQLGQSAQSNLIVRSLAQLAQTLNCSVVAEGIETDEQRERLLNLNVSHGQGALLGKPLSGAETTELLELNQGLLEQAG
ncbi:GGDEF-domain containing protein [Hyphomicrobium methylovorum]|uniref:putative bifunctional diguanylate cyclase/phosphodiesterase n=1 Tax=Hyphomicrobium methylovorum TaxID=84 RepID=UPI0015E76120|nr:EAL domain-containing protein [Hyphomicrobium methylovorum]MBA2127467.1 GGDEF-domain containing protein [Hyphomicrobium methylovorum]